MARAEPVAVDQGDALSRAAEVLEGATEVALSCHINPDADALGSMLGLSAFLRARGKRTVCSYGNDPFEHPRWLKELPGSDALVHPRRFPKAPEVLVTLDCASLDRLGQLAATVARARNVVWIDHHASNEGLGTVPLIDPKASSTAEMVFRLMQRMGGEIPAEAAACLYAGLVTDTGRFQYEATSPETLRLAAELRQHPFDHAKLAQALFEDNGLAYLKLLGTALHRVAFDPEAGLVWTYLTQADIQDAGIHPTEGDDLIDVVRTAREADVAAVLKQQRDGRFKVSMRSRGGADLAALAARFGGGGHRLAAGFTSKVGLEETVRQIAEALREQAAARG
ncbi:MAG: bifunctional oligoribonuclease/PAP phosphatase NrnA [Actinomycetota bacterium]|nr:bifunctional oligoribonuclease/PAP phosphatase NrnA [Actinomycetota bacterium]